MSYHRVQVCVENRRVQEVFPPMYIVANTRALAKAEAMNYLRDDIDAVVRSFGPCRVTLQCHTMREGIVQK